MKDNQQEIKNIFKGNSNDCIQEILRSKYYHGRAIFDPDNLRSVKTIEQISQKADTVLSGKVKKTLNSLHYAIPHNNLQEVQNILNSNSDSDIQKVLIDKVNNYYSLRFCCFNRRSKYRKGTLAES